MNDNFWMKRKSALNLLITRKTAIWSDLQFRFNDLVNLESNIFF